MGCNSSRDINTIKAPDRARCAASWNRVMQSIGRFSVFKNEFYLYCFGASLNKERFIKLAETNFLHQLIVNIINGTQKDMDLFNLFQHEWNIVATGLTLTLQLNDPEWSVVEHENWLTGVSYFYLF